MVMVGVGRRCGSVGRRGIRRGRVFSEILSAVLIPAEVGEEEMA